MKSPQDMQFIQIDITNACNLRCSNCTRFCGNHKKPFLMDIETFRKAVDSLKDFDGVTGIIGGEPTLHPDFENFALYMQSVHGKQKDIMCFPEKDFIYKMQEREFSAERIIENKDGSRYMKKRGAGLWSNMSAGYRRHYEVIQDTFGVQFLNDHLNPSYHQPGLFSRKVLGISDEEWIRLRDNCWMQNSWSATITPKGAFFCEVAGALDMLFNGPGGWKIEPGWWKRQPEDFKDQLHWCELCGFALKNIFSRDAKEEVDDVSPTVYEKLRKLDSPKLKDGHINLVKIENGEISEESKAERPPFIFGVCYIENYADRFQKENSILFDIDYDEFIVESSDNFGQLLNKAIIESKKEWILIRTSSKAGITTLVEFLGNSVFNPGVLHKGTDYLFFSKKALSLRKIGFDGIAHMLDSSELIDSWENGKIIDVTDIKEMTRIGSDLIEGGKSYAIWGAGILGEYFAKTVRLSGGEVSFFIDKSIEKQGEKFGGIPIFVPEILREQRNDFDAILIANHSAFDEIKKDLLNMGIDEGKILMPYEMIESIGVKS